MKYGKGSFFRDPPSPYISFHFRNSATEVASSDTLALICDNDFSKSFIVSGLSEICFSGFDWEADNPSCFVSSSILSCSRTSLMGWYAAATHKFLISLPEKPSVIFESCSKSKFGSRSSLDRITLNILTRFSAVGKSTRIRRDMRLRTASSKSKGRLVAANTSTLSFSLVLRPSQCVINSFLIFRIASCSPDFSRLPRILSTSSMKITVGEILLANVKIALTYFSPSPNHFDAIVAIDTLIKFAMHCVAIAFASIVFPVPGGPKRRIPLQGFVRLPLVNNSGLWSGSITSSRRFCFTSSSAPISSNPSCNSE
mmetsp:Transcript_3840/g.5362  ORF Transcript_3840/g.5362 Transcript_3840/m.5362 type:complete len:312 (-) Transcript_3840:1683-2618(-)